MIMETMPFLILAIYGIGVIITICALIWVISKRIAEKKKENFENRDN